jgi:hypothetical protein
MRRDWGLREAQFSKSAKGIRPYGRLTPADIMAPTSLVPRCPGRLSGRRGERRGGRAANVTVGAQSP